MSLLPVSAHLAHEVVVSVLRAAASFVVAVKHVVVLFQAQITRPATITLVAISRMRKEFMAVRALWHDTVLESFCQISANWIYLGPAHLLQGRVYQQLGFLRAGFNHRFAVSSKLLLHLPG